MSHFEMLNDRRRAIMDGNTLSLFRNNGIKKTHWVPVWPPAEVDAKLVKRLAGKWVNKGKIPQELLQ